MPKKKQQPKKIPDLIDIIRLWLKDEKSGYQVVRTRSIWDDQTYGIISAGLTTFSLGYVYVTHVDIVKSRGPYSAGVYRPEDPEFFNKLRIALGITDARTNTSTVPVRSSKRRK